MNLSNKLNLDSFVKEGNKTVFELMNTLNSLKSGLTEEQKKQVAKAEKDSEKAFKSFVKISQDLKDIDLSGL